MVKTYCNEGQLTASITINNIVYTTNKPPLKVFIYQGYRVLKRVIRFPGYNDILIGHYGINELLIPLNRSSNISIEDWYIFPDGNVELNGMINTNKIFIKTLIVPMNDYYYNTLETFANKSLFICRDNEKIIFMTDYIPDYIIKCDGCKPGECKGKTVRYPGTICLNCKKMNQSLTNSIECLK